MLPLWIPLFALICYQVPPYNALASHSGMLITSVLEKSKVTDNTYAIKTHVKMHIYLRTNGSGGLYSKT